MALYNLRHSGDQYRVTKFSAELVPESFYLMTPTECQCPAGHRASCRHREMFPILITRVNSGWLYDFDRGIWASQITEWEEPEGLDEDEDTETPTNELAADELLDAQLTAVINGEPLDGEILSPSDVHSSYDLSIDMFSKDVTPPQPSPFKRRF